MPSWGVRMQDLGCKPRCWQTQHPAFPLLTLPVFRAVALAAAQSLNRADRPPGLVAADAAISDMFFAFGQKMSGSAGENFQSRVPSTRRRR
jgi:hypothetical protein